MTKYTYAVQVITDDDKANVHISTEAGDVATFRAFRFELELMIGQTIMMHVRAQEVKA
jgi:hypothetical protein